MLKSGGVLIALNSSLYSKYGFIFFLISAGSWLIRGYNNKDYPLMILNAVFIIIDVIGIYNWFIAKTAVF